MTIAASGAISMSDINEELDLSASTNQSMSDSQLRWLAADTSGAIAMSQLRGTQAIRLVDTNVISSTGVTYSATMSFGPNFTGRQLIVAYCAINEDGGVLNCTNFDVAGGNASNLVETWSDGGAGTAAGMANYSASSATSGNVTITFQDAFTRCYVAIFAAAGINSITDQDTTSSNGGSNLSNTLNCGSNDYVVQVVCRKVHGDDDVTPRIGTAVVQGPSGNMHVTMSIGNRLSADTTKTWGWTGDATSYRYSAAITIYG